MENFNFLDNPFNVLSLREDKEKLIIIAVTEIGEERIRIEHYFNNLKTYISCNNKNVKTKVFNTVFGFKFLVKGDLFKIVECFDNDEESIEIEIL